MKLLSFAVPCYNSEAYMEKCIESLLAGGEEVEILIIDDGSKDRTAEIADSYAEKYPTIVKAIHKENGGHGSAVNTGIANATGLYFKVVDSDDWVKEEVYRQILAKQLNISPHQLSYVTNSGEGEGLVFYGSTIIPFKDKFDNSLMLYALMTSKPDEVEKRKKLGIGERDD